MDFQSRAKLKGTEVELPAGAQAVGTVPDGEIVRVTVTLKRKSTAPVAAMPRAQFRHRTPAEFADAYGADADALSKVMDFAQAYHLDVVDSDAAKRRVILSGTARAISDAFGTQLRSLVVPQTGRTFRTTVGIASVPSELDSAVEAVLGLDTRPVVEPRFVKNSAAASVTYAPPQVASLYGFPQNMNGAGQTIAILEFGAGFSYPDLDAYFASLGLRSPTITVVSVDNATNSPGSANDLENTMDIEIAGAIANGANIAVYFAPNTDQGFTNAILDVAHDSDRMPSVISISWGSAEDVWSAQSRTAVNSAIQDAVLQGMTVIAASGDSGSSDGQGDGKFHVDFPASSPFVLACGGTTLLSRGDTISSETVWNNNLGATGGGVSTVFTRPAYQDLASIPVHPQTGFGGRGVPDVSANADPETGYRIRLNGTDTVVGGTSAVAPFWAGLAAILNQKLGARVGFVNEALYSLGRQAFRDIISGNNDDANLGAYPAGPGWNACTGLGSPNAAAILAAITSGGSAMPAPVGTSTTATPAPPTESDAPYPWNF
jgi:kumamolisin